MAWIIPKKGVDIDEDSVREFCKGNIAYYKIPRYVEFTDAYPMTASGKIMKFRLQELARNRVGV